MDPKTLRRDKPDMPCATRSFRCPDGLTRMVTYDQVYWDSLDWMVKEGFRTEDHIVALSWKYAQEDRAKGKDPEAVFSAYLTLSIYEFYHWYLQERDGLTNDNNELWVKHSREKRPYPKKLFFPRVKTDFAFVPTVIPLSKISQYMPAYRS